MDINDDYDDRSRISNRSHEDNFNEHSELEDDNSAINWSVNGLRNLQIGDCDDNYQMDNQDVLADVNCGGVHDYCTPYSGGGMSDYFNSNIQGTEVGETFKNQSGALYDNSNKYARFNRLPMLSEVLRISKILRRLMVENNRKTAIDLCGKLDAAVRNQSNATYICRSFEILFDNMITVLRQCPTECLEHASKILGIMGYINRYEFIVYKENLTKSYSIFKNIRKYLMIALRTTISCDAVNLDLKAHSESLLGILKEYLENAEVAENFMAISETICELSKHYHLSFQRHFTDIVDIIIGWHLEADQPGFLKRHCAKVLQQFADYFLGELDFTLGLLGQFIEDIDACGEDIIADDAQHKSKQQTEARVGSFIGAFTSIIKAMVTKGMGLNHFSILANILKDAKLVVNKVAKICFRYVSSVGEESVTNLNEFYCVISSFDKTVENLSDLEKIMELQLNHLVVFNENQVSSFIYMILNIVRQYRTQLPLRFVSLIMKKENDALQDLKLNIGTKSYRLLLKTYHEILIIKNVPLLQEAYRHIVKDLNEIISNLKTMPNEVLSLSSRSELMLSFYLAALSALACQTSSIIGMYALNPSILDLLIKNCQAANQDLWSKYPSLHQALLEIIIEHSSKNHNFRQSSRLLTQHQDSPSSENFGTILNFLANLFKWKVCTILTQWLEKLLEELQEYSPILTTNDDFLAICENIINLSLGQPHISSNILKSLVKYPKMPGYILSRIRNTALCVIQNCDDKLLASYCQLLALLPLHICLSTDNQVHMFNRQKEKSRELYRFHKTTANYSRLRPKYFLPFLDTLDRSYNPNYNYLYETFVNKSVVYLQKHHTPEYMHLLQKNRVMRESFLQYEAARFCVSQKLRTPLGKPQDTFLAIEARIMNYARLLSEKEVVPSNISDIRSVMRLQQNCHMLITFLDNLEKHIYNAAEGTAFAMLPAEKPAKTFFRVNVSTCGEWFKRIRTAVNLIALHSMSPEIVIRNCENMLNNDSITANQGLLDRTITSIVWALSTCGESDTILGLQSWLKAKQCKGYEWIQHVAENVAGQYEKALVGFMKVLNTQNSVKLDAFTKEFIKKQLTECLYNLTIWTDIANTQQKSSQMNLHLDVLETICQSSWNSQVPSKEREILTAALLEMTEWNNFKGEHNVVPQVETFSYPEMMKTLKYTCVATAVSAAKNKSIVLDAVNNCVQKALQAELMNRYESGFHNHQLDELMLLNHVAHQLEKDENISIPSKADCAMSPPLLNETLSWCLTIGHNKPDEVVSLLLSTVANARKNCNTNYSQSLLERFFKWKSIDMPLTEIAAQIQTKQLILDYNDMDMIHGIEELTKHLQAQCTTSLDAVEFGSACCYQIIEQHSKSASAPKNPIPQAAQNLLLNLSDWLTTNRLQNNTIGCGRQLQNLQNLLPEISFCINTDQRIANVLSPSEYGVGKLLNASILSNNEVGEAWFAFGNWCYRWGKKVMEASGNDQQSCDRKDFKLTNRNISSIREILQEDSVNENDLNRLVDLLNLHMVKAVDDENIEGVSAHSHNTIEILENELKNICDITREKLNAILCIWRQAQKGVYAFYEEATTAYFKYLAIQSNVSVTTSKKTSSEIEDCTFVTTTLRLLRLIVKHAIGLQDVLEDGLRNTPLRPWKVIVPQLFSRLNHHEPYVRHSVSDLLCRLAVNQPQLIIFPAVVGAKQELKHSDNAQSQIQLTNCFVTLLSALSQQAPGVVLQVQLLVKELRRITLLWEEHWVHRLAQLYAEYSHLFNALEAESKKISDEETMMTKYNLFQHHLLNDFKQIAATTAKEPETNYERNFKERFQPHIELVLKELQKPSDAAKPAEYWQKIRQLYNIFQQRPLRGNSSTLRISDISPVLANMQNTSIGMPGVDTYEQSSIFIKSVDSTLIILPTKTKPKKLTLLGSNGQSYTFLFKGQEDLHLDERIMQFLSISNSMMARSYGSKSKTDCFRAHHYSVIPLGSQSGLISWVENCTPLFAIYKKWQQREATLKQQQKERQTSKSVECIAQSPAATNTLRPSELFYNKLTPLLTERNIKTTDPRRQWPMPILKRVLRELCAETPKDLLSKEIWCYSTNSVDWRQSVRRYTMSLAVMSIIGYVIGLGDRHLDNILIKLGTGEIVHIDYNVCFEKGKSLRVPEKVPFRLSQNFKDALGLVGVEGPFRLACSHILKILRKERETLLTLLEAFVYDPLVDWTVSDDGSTTMARGTSAHTAAIMISSVGAANKDLQLSPKDATFKNRKNDVDLSRQTLTLKVSEIKPNWLRYKNDFEIQLTNVRTHVSTFLEIRQKILYLEQERDNFTKQQAMVQELEALGSARGSHALNTVTMRYYGYKKDSEAFSKTKSLVQKTVEDLELVSVTYFNTLLRPEAIMIIDIKPIENADNELEFLKEWNDEVYSQAKKIKNEMENCILQAQKSVIECRDMLLFYSQVMSYFPHGKIKQNQLLKYKKEYANLVDFKENQLTLYRFSDDNQSNINGQCQLYFKGMLATYLDIQASLAQVQQAIFQPHCPEEVADTAETVLKLLDGNHERQHILLSISRRIQKAYDEFNSKDNKHEYFLLDHRLGFLQLIEKFIENYHSIIQNLQCPNILRLYAATLQSLLNLRRTFEMLCEKAMIIFITGDNENMQHSDMEYLTANPDFHAALDNTKVLNNQTILTMQQLQERLSYLQESHPNTFIDNIMSCWNTNISHYMLNCHADLLEKLIMSIKTMSESHKYNDSANTYDMRKIYQLIRDMIHDIAKKLFAGLLPYVLQVVTLRISDLRIPTDVDDSSLIESDRLCERLLAMIQKNVSSSIDERILEHHVMLMEHHRFVTTAYYWLNEKNLADGAHEQTLGIIMPKQKFLSNIHNISQGITVWNTAIARIQIEHEVLRKNVRELLERNNYESLVKFNEIVDGVNQAYVFYLNLTTLLTEYTAVLLKFEIACDDKPFESLVRQYQEERERLQFSEASITDVERNLVQLLDPEGKIDQHWIANVSDLLDEMLFVTQKNLCDLEKEITLMESILQEDGHQLQLIIDSSIRADLRQLFKMLAKTSKQTIKSENGDLFHNIREIQQEIKSQQILLNELQNQMFQREFDSSTLLDIEQKANELYGLCQKNNERLGALIEQFLNLDLDKKAQQRRESPAGNDNAVNKDALNINSQVCEQKRNAYAVSVWKRIRMKLEGRDPDPNRRNSVAEQVDYVIGEATNEENLASLYEGWTPWV